jgi:hypothetical protein
VWVECDPTHQQIAHAVNFLLSPRGAAIHAAKQPDARWAFADEAKIHAAEQPSLVVWIDLDSLDAAAHRPDTMPAGWKPFWVK